MIEIVGEGDPFEGRSIHPAAELFPLIEGSAFDELVDDIVQHGLRERIAITPDGQILDGRNRLRACRKAGIEAQFRVESGEPFAYVISVNLHRRHLTDGQRAMIAAKIARTDAGGRPGNRGDITPVPTTAEAADLLHVGRESVRAAKAVRAHGDDALIAATEAGQIPVGTAARVARDLDRERQREYVRRVDNGALPTRLATDLGAASRHTPVSEPVPRRNDGRTADRHRVIGVPALRSLSEQLGALALLVDSTPDGLDPSLTPAEAARWADDLGKGKRALNRVITLLNKHKEITP